MNPTSHDLSVAQLLGELKATTESTLSLVKELKENTEKRTDGLDARVTKLEQWRSYLLGASAVVGFVAAQLGKLVTFGVSP